MTDPGTTKRSIYFFRVRVAPDTNGRAQEFNPDEAVRRIAELSFARNITGASSAYHTYQDGSAVAVWPLPQTPAPRVGLKLGGLRRQNLPHLEDGGNLDALNLQVGKNLAELTHMVFFKEKKQLIVASEANFFGPRPTRFPYYLQAKFSDMPQIFLELLVNEHMAKKLNTLEDIRLLRLKLRRSNADVLKEASPSLAKALQAACEDADAPVFELTLRADERSRQALNPSLIDMVKNIIGLGLVDRGREEIVVRGYSNETSRVEEFDLLKDRAVVKTVVMKESEKSRNVDSEDMISKMIESYEGEKSWLLKAPSLASLRQ